MEESAKMLDTAEPTMENTESSVAEPEETTVENDKELEFTDTQVDESKNESEETPKEEEKEEKKEQSKEENSKYAQARRKAEAETQKKVDEAYKKGRLEAFAGKLNPYTQTVINDETDIQVYQNMYELEKAGKDPVADYANYIADKQRQELKEQAEKQKLKDEAEKDIADFTEKYPDVNLSELLEDETFKDYMEGKRKPLITIYENYQKMQTAFRNKGVEVAKQTIANSQATPGSLNSGAEVNTDYSNMSDEEFERVLYAVKNGDLK